MSSVEFVEIYALFGRTKRTKKNLRWEDQNGCGGGYRNTGVCKNSTDAETLDTGIRGSGGTFVV